MFNLQALCMPSFKCKIFKVTANPTKSRTPCAEAGHECKIKLAVVNARATATHFLWLGVYFTNHSDFKSLFYSKSLLNNNVLFCRLNVLVVNDSIFNGLGMYHRHSNSTAKRHSYVCSDHKFTKKTVGPRCTAHIHFCLNFLVLK